jgi:hypothetical protein
VFLRITKPRCFTDDCLGWANARRRMPNGTVFVGVLLALVVSPVSAGRPFATEDAGVLGAGECELEVYASRRTTGWWVQPGCGIGHQTQLAFGGGHSKAGAALSTSVVVSGKSWLRELTDERMGVALAYAVGGERGDGKSFRHESTAFTAVVSSPVTERLTLHGNFGWTRSQTERVSSTTWALAIERRDGDGLDIGAEFYGDDRTAAWMGVGARYAVRPAKLFLDCSWAAQTNSTHAKRVTVGLKLAF